MENSRTVGRSGKTFTLQEKTSEYGGKVKLWVLTFDLPGEKVNKLGTAVIQEATALVTELEKLGGSGEIEVLVLRSGKKAGFIAGADIEMIRTSSNAEELSLAGQQLFSRWEDLPFPTVAALNGAALGGGCEWALASSAIVMSNDPGARIGLPETMLGLVPGAGGCVRLPRKVGVATALDLILTGKTLTGDRAYKGGLTEGVLPKENFDDAVLKWAVANASALRGGKKLSKEPKLGGMGGALGSLMENNPIGRSVIYKKAREGVISKTRGKYPAVLAVIDLMKANGASYGPKLRGTARDKAMAREAKVFGEMAKTEVSRNLINLFFLAESVKKSTGLSPGTQVKTTPVRMAGVLGAGVMGGGIAQLLAEKNIPTRMKDLTNPALAAGIQAASRIFKKQVERRKINKREMMQKINHIAAVTDFSGFGTVSMVVEAVVENMDVKKKVLRELEEHVAADCVIASNTSSLSISEMQSAMKSPERFAGMHFFNPVHRMPLIEVIRGAKSSDEAVAAVFQFSKQIGKTPIVVKDAPGFLVNRLLAPYLNEAVYLLADGAPIEEIDEALLDFGMPMGPMELIDEVGIDVADKVAHVLHEGFGARMLPTTLNGKLKAAGYLGKKNQKGLYSYVAPGGRGKKLDPKVYEILGVTPTSGSVSREEIVDRCILPMINEATRCLDEGIVDSASEVDLGMIMGTGFPPFRGGLLRHADTLGAAALVEKLKKYQPRFGARFEPAPALLARAQNSQSFYGA
jgi:3-hydroxyacyl-CoA dehydrogenase/enoyl-CoA hydratase/3-hydroxybutyryl-CoA epimerase